MGREDRGRKRERERERGRERGREEEDLLKPAQSINDKASQK